MRADHTTNLRRFHITLCLRFHARCGADGAMMRAPQITKYLVFSGLAVALAGSTYLAWRYRTIAMRLQKPPELSYAQLSDELVRSEANLPVQGALNRRDAIIAVRDYVYRKYDLGPEDLPRASAATLYVALNSPDSNNMMCGAVGLAYTWALQSIGIPARFVQLAGDDYLAGKDEYQTHVTVEAFVDGKWEISDPTYNLSVACSDDPSTHLATPAVRSCIKRGQHLVLLPGATQLRDVNRYGAKVISPEKYALYFSAYIRRSVSIAGVSESADAFPENDWLNTSLRMYSEKDGR